MARLARVVVPGFPHHMTQRGNRRQATFFCDDDYEIYLVRVGRVCSEGGRSASPHFSQGFGDCGGNDEPHATCSREGCRRVTAVCLERGMLAGCKAAGPGCPQVYWNTPRTNGTENAAAG